ncbi:cytochrome c oxidase subunit II [Marinitenerispora sediminis]|uniref:cytochrome-c oxidase n=1 Tax=Marinitenerispora sediminis TaxID=1931232 RepID=A0A368T7H1_9ACTN|nr:cytochrome c oxidase subunit II [Marinitenerispora sediminis]RCV54135.1 cytochrome c oxidase subunit II [Marinitenerispora sediminis]RCV56781.1 cytochrome c oxidase subunit II [Marinitenerispora sediminis]RCV59628.1 cytochrome c oxidase subunit II [Marinitenerispora sediminis]
MPEPITEQAERVLALWQGSWVAAFAVGILVWGLIIWSVIFHRKRSEQLPPQVRYNLPIEALYTVLPIVVIAVLFYFTARDQTYLLETDEPADVNIHVNAFQWSWQFVYEGEEDVNGHDVSVAGIPGEDPQLVIPNDSVVHFDLESPDVIHSFWIPAFLFKMDVIPGHPNEFQVRVNPDVEGTFAGRCAELCGVDHSRMLFTVKVVSPEEYQAWLEHQKQNPEALPEPVPAEQPAVSPSPAAGEEGQADTAADAATGEQTGDDTDAPDTEAGSEQQEARQPDAAERAEEEADHS